MTLSVILPALNEAGNIARLVSETFAALPPTLAAEVIVVDDGSDDGTGTEVLALLPQHRGLRYLRHARRCGQSTAIRTGVLAAKGPIIATMDGDGQNDPADIAPLLARLGARMGEGPVAVCGVRAKRRAKGSRRIASVVANGVRNAVFRDNCPDSGCGIKVYWREAYLRLPYFSSMHRFMPTLFVAHGHEVNYAPVNDRPRLVGQSKYTNFSRALTGIYDLFGVVWLRRRTRLPEIAFDSAPVQRVSGERDVSIVPATRAALPREGERG